MTKYWLRNFRKCGIAETRNYGESHPFVFLQDIIMSCTRCHALKRKCDKQGDDAPCSRCANLGLECVARERKAKTPRARYNNGKKRAAPGTADAAARKTGRKKTKITTATANGASIAGPYIKNMNMTEDIKTTTNAFFSTPIDLGALKPLKDLSPSHWGLKCAVICLMSMASRKMNIKLLNIASSFALRCRFAHYFPVLCSPQVVRDVKIGEYDDIPSHVLESHDEAVGVSSSAAGNWNNDTGRMILVSQKEFDRSGALLVLSPEARRLLVSEEDFPKMNTVFNPHDYIRDSVLDEKDINASTHASTVTVVEYKTKFSGPLTKCVPNIMVHTLNGSVRAHSYQTIWFGRTGYDGCYIQEFVPVDKVSGAATAPEIRATAEEEDIAARAMISFKN